MNELPPNLHQISLEKKLDLIESFLNASCASSDDPAENELHAINS